MGWIHEKKLIFIHIPKCAGTSVEILFNMKTYDSGFGIINNKAIQHYTWYEIKNHIGNEAYNNYFKFSICRNPYTRTISDYFWLKSVNEIENISFDEYLDYAEKIIITRNFSEKIWHDHFIPQYEFICDSDDKIIVDKLFKIENLNEFNEYFNVVLEKHNVTNSDNIILTHEQKEKIAKIYKKDFEILGYDM